MLNKYSKAFGKENYPALLKREIFIDGEINEELANKIVAQLLFLESEDSKKDIYLYLNSPGGSVNSGLAIFDTIQYIKPDVQTICDDSVSGIASFILCGGKKGKRKCFENSRISLCKLSKNGTYFDESNFRDLSTSQKEIFEDEKTFKECLRASNTIQYKLSEMTGQNIERIKEDSKYWSDYDDHYLSPTEAKAYGVIDQILER